MTSNRVYLIVADETEEFGGAMHYACAAAKTDNVHLGVLYIIPDSGFVNWGNLEERMQQERRQEAEKLLQAIAEKITASCGLTPSLYVGEGSAPDAVAKTIAENPNISVLFLGASTKAGGPGPLVTYFSGKGISKLPVPMVLVPDHVTYRGS